MIAGFLVVKPARATWPVELAWNSGQHMHRERQVQRDGKSRRKASSISVSLKIRNKTACTCVLEWCPPTHAWNPCGGRHMPAPYIRHLGGANNARKEQTKVYVRALGGAKKEIFSYNFCISACYCTWLLVMGSQSLRESMRMRESGMRRTFHFISLKRIRVKPRRCHDAKRRCHSSSVFIISTQMSIKLL